MRASAAAGRFEGNALGGPLDQRDLDLAIDLDAAKSRRGPGFLMQILAARQDGRGQDAASAVSTGIAKRARKAFIEHGPRQGYRLDAAGRRGPDSPPYA